MEAIITNVKKGSGHHKYNGLTFKAKEILKDLICLQIPSQLDVDKFDSVDFSFNEITIVDIKNEIEKVEASLKQATHRLYHCKLEDSISIRKGELFLDEKKLENLKSYVSHKKIQL